MRFTKTCYVVFAERVVSPPVSSLTLAVPRSIAFDVDAKPDLRNSGRISIKGL